jgi:[ribosomal protein S18]-alanine N-acetyltransferase
MAPNSPADRDMDRMAESESNSNQLMPHALRPMELRDLGDVAEIEREAFPTTWPPTAFRRELSNRLARYLVAFERREEGAPAPPPPETVPAPRPGLLGRLLGGLRAGGRARNLGPDRPPGEALVSGYVGIWFMADEAHITSIASRDAHRGKGVGELLLIGAVELALLRGSRVVTLEVRVSNEPAKTLYRKYDFHEMGVRKNYYTDNNEDAYVMTTDPITSPGYRTRFDDLVSRHRERWGRSDRSVTSVSQAP